MRIWVNSELEEIEQALKARSTCYAPGGRLSIISFHSLEDRIVKRLCVKTAAVRKFRQGYR